MRKFNFTVHRSHAVFTDLSLFEFSYYAEKYGLISEEFDQVANLQPGESLELTNVMTITRTA